ncbi:probable sphingolipid transporter spinster homolog 2 isoform X1 [Impatiens glandulifera]|uniref:probable sphingolipid transporter spinster homolog 2 isoform X1 n=1 Tax=Impatiens glandulifera TaxID=253017 RepID=UPI001FB0DFA6|nr:probable sphingolipid transporter spinster homolog 2 isoform X1 [Impatiens glandulifera]
MHKAPPLISNIMNGYLASLFGRMIQMVFGGIKVVCGMVGTVVGGYVLDLMSSTISNAFKDYTKNWRITALILTSVLFLAASTWFLGIYVHKTDKLLEDPDEITDKCIKTHLIEEKAEKVETAGEL